MRNPPKTIGIIGFGNMGQAIAEQLKAKYQIYIFDKDKEKTKNVSGINIADDTIGLVKQSDTVILAVKPQDFDNLLIEIRDHAKDKLIISIAAGITIVYIEKSLVKARVVRVMPNLGAKIGDAESSLCAGKSSTEDDLMQVKELFDRIGTTWIIPEQMLDAATAICGSGPAYIFYDMEKNNIDPMNIPEEIKQEYIDRLKIAAEDVGFNPDTALKFAAATTGTSINLAMVTGLSPQALRKQVASKGGTTEAALGVLFMGGSWAEAAKAALRRAKELSK